MKRNSYPKTGDPRILSNDVSGYTVAGCVQMLAIVLLSAALGTGCTALVVGGAGNSSSYPSSGASASQKSADDRISNAIRSQYRADSYLHSAKITVTTRSGFVTLRGSVGSFQARSQAETLAVGVQGVNAVKNEIQVTSDYSGN